MYWTRMLIISGGCHYKYLIFFYPFWPCFTTFSAVFPSYFRCHFLGISFHFFSRYFSIFKKKNCFKLYTWSRWRSSWSVFSLTSSASSLDRTPATKLGMQRDIRPDNPAFWISGKLGMQGDIRPDNPAFWISGKRPDTGNIRHLC